jgi:sugar phosphate isomerase/epimerase
MNTNRSQPMLLAQNKSIETTSPAAMPERPLRLGLTAATYGIRLRADHPSRFRHALDVLEHAHAIGAGGVQLGVEEDWTPDFVSRLRTCLDQTGMYFEGQVRLPRQESDVPRFEKQIRLARAAGASVVRTVALSGRRYETFSTAEAFREFADRSRQSIRWAEPIVRAHHVRLAVENHKDWRIPGLLDIVRTLASEYVGVCLDTGNSISLLEDPMEVVEAYAPFAFTTHFKDMAVQTYEDGFLLSEVPLGDGFLDLDRFVTVVRKANPRITFNLEMITRDPLRVPCLSDSYWPTFSDVKAPALAQALELVKSHPPVKDLPRVSGLDEEQRIAFEEANNLASLEFAKKRLGFA